MVIRKQHLARLERDPLAVRPTDDVTLEVVLAGCELAYRDRARDAGLTLESHVCAGGLSVKVDERRLTQVVGNLIDNAIKFTPRGGVVKISSSVTDAGVTIAVEDSGPGIPEAERAHVMERFYQVRKGDDRVNGLGLGLAICARVVEAHGGALTIDESEWRGTRVTIALPPSISS